MGSLHQDQLARRARPVLPCLGWGRNGHKVVGAIASEYLTPQAKAAVQTLLEDRSLADVSKGLTWEQIAEWVRHVLRQTTRLYTHFNLEDSKRRMESLDTRF